MKDLECEDLLEDLDGLFLANFFFGDLYLLVDGHWDLSCLLKVSLDEWEEGVEEDMRSWVIKLSDSWMFLITPVLSSIDSKEVEDIF